MSARHDGFIRECIELAKHAGQRGNHPFGALLVDDGRILLASENTVNTDNDCTRHAELNLVSDAFRQFGPGVLAKSVLYTSTEPCAMCAGAIFWAGIPTVVFGCSSGSAGRITGSELVMSCRDILAKGSKQVEVIGPILEAEGIAVVERFRGNIVDPARSIDNSAT